MTDKTEIAALVERLRETAEALRCEPVRDFYGDPVYGPELYEEIDQAAAALRDLSAEVERMRGALTVIANASEASERMFGGPMSEVTRVFKHITRVSRQALSALAPKEPEHG